MCITYANRYFSNLLDLFYPNPCLVCQSALQPMEEQICTHCRFKLPETKLHQRDAEPEIGSRFAGRIRIEFVYPYLYYAKQGSVQRIIRSLKYKGNKEVGRVMGRWYGYQLENEVQLSRQIDLITSVPLHPSRKRKRGYNQSDWFGRGLSDELNVRFEPDILKRNRNTITQTGKNRFDRWQNVGEVFSVREPETIKEKRIALVDDVLTTGATLEACASALLLAGCQSVGVITIAATR